MKKLIFKFSLFIFGVTLILISYFTQPSAEMNGNNNLTSGSIIDTQFQVGAVQDGHYSLYNIIKDSLHFNVWHHYTTLLNGWGDDPADNYLDSVGQYASIVTGRKGQNDTKGLRTYFDRPTVSYVISGQRTDYECENVPESSLYWFNSYKSNYNNQNVYDTIDRSRYGIGENVKCCRRLNSNPDAIAGFIDTGIKANRNLSYSKTANSWTGDDAWDWYVMPRIRIDSSYASQYLNFNEPICKIIITGWNGDTVRNVTLNVRNFKKGIDSIYNGNYLEQYYFNGGIDSLLFNTATIKSHFLPPDSVYAYDWKDTTCHVDIKIYWTGKCDMWIDRVRLENEPAHQYLNSNDPYHQTLIDKIDAEIGWANNNKNIPNYFYFEENTFSHFPLIQALNKQITDNSQNPNSLIIWYNDYLVNAQIPEYPGFNTHLTPTHVRELLIDSCKLKTIIIGWYGLEGWEDTELPTRISYHPNTLVTESDSYKKDKGVLSYKSSPAFYDTWLQNKIEVKVDVTTTMDMNNLMLYLSKPDGTQSGLNVIYCPQAHSFTTKGGPLKEPTNEEIELQTDLALMHNTKGIMYYWFGSWGQFADSNYSRGIMDDSLDNGNLTPRYNTVYGQNKFAKIQELSSKLNKWGLYFMKFDPNSTKTCSYRLETERDAFITNTYFSDIITYKTSNVYPDCTEDNPGGNNPLGLVFECKEFRYLQAATFQTSASDINKYFMILNRRCSPYIDSTTEDKRGGKRNIRIKFDANTTEFANFNNWEIIDIDSNKTVAVFDKRASTLINLGWYKPGEGKLYKIVPVMLEGGSFVGDEYVTASAGSFECKGNITNNGYELEIEKGVTINFKDNVGINFSNNNFNCGVSGSNVNNVMLKGSGNEKWNGINFTECNTIQILNTTFQDIKYSDQQNLQNTALCLNNCANFSITNSRFLLTTPSSGIYALYSEINEIKENIIGYNSFEVNCSYSPTPINLNSTGSIEIPVLLQSNTLENTQSTGGVGISILNVTGGAIKSNEINNFSTGINSLSSTLDISGNLISSDLNNSTGIFETAESCLNLGYINSLHIGGDNLFSNLGTGVNNILTDYSTFNINDGYNTFNVYQSNSNCHLRGSFCGEPNDPVDALYNCFQVDETNTDQIDTVIWSNTSYPVEFYFKPYSCEMQSKENFIVLNMGFNFKDTIYRKSNGGSGGNSNPEESQTSNYKTLKDSINLNLRTRNYLILEDQCQRLLLNYPDSSASIGTVAKLYLSSLTLDTLGDKIGSLKTFFETLILNNQGKTALINRAFYFVQKCKVSLKQYTSALQGFELIITQNPYTYEGLIASWDYASTQLLDSLNGGSGGINSKNINENETELTKQITDCYENDLNKDTIKFTKSDRKIIIQNTERAFDDTKTNGTKKYDDVKKRSERGDEKAKVEYQKMKTLNETNKIKQPRTTIELNTIIQKDFQKVFVKTEKPKKQENTIPTKFELYQNYPNPFNPTTKIAFDLPKDVRVKLIIYDILGREIKTIVNNEFKPAGKYINEFNGSQFASGVYFARLLVNEGKDFIAVKKLVLIK